MLLEKEYKGKSQWIQEFDILRNKPTAASIFCHSVTQVKSNICDHASGGILPEKASQCENY